MRLSHLLGIALLAVCGVSHAQFEADLKLYGSDTVGEELAPAMIKKWMQTQGYNQISERLDAPGHLIIGLNDAGKSLTVGLEARGSSTAFKALASETAHIGMSSRPISAREVDALKKFGKCDTAECEYVIGLDGIAVIVNRKNPLQKLDRASLQRIFSGEVKNWSEVGGKAGPIHVFALDDNSGTYDTFKSLVLDKKSLVAAQREASHAAIAEMVARDPDGIGFVGLPFVDKNKALAIADGEARAIVPDAFSVATEDYVLARRLFFYLPEVTASPLARQFVEFAVSDAGQDVAEEVGFVSQALIASEISVGSDAPEEYRTLISGAQRLSLNFRFLPGSPVLDNKAQRDIARLKAFMAQAKNKGKELMLYGFADSNEAMPIVSLQLSTDRADTVADLLVKEGMRPRKVRGFGNVVAVASNDSEEGRAKNRRVEVWVR